MPRHTYAPRTTRQVMLPVQIFLTPSNLDYLAELARMSQSTAKSYLQELVECALDERRQRTNEPNWFQKEQVERDVMHSGLEADCHCYYSKR